MTKQARLDKRARGSMVSGLIARGRWLVASASLTLRPARPPGPATVEGLRQKDAALDVLVGDLHTAIVDEERRLASSLAPTTMPVIEDPWAGAVAQMNLGIASVAAVSWRPRRQPDRSREVSSKLEAAAVAMRVVVSNLREQRAAHQSAINNSQAHAESAVARGEDFAASRALGSVRLTRRLLSALELELVAREAMLSEWTTATEELRGAESQT